MAGEIEIDRLEAGLRQCRAELGHVPLEDLESFRALGSYLAEDAAVADGDADGDAAELGGRQLDHGMTRAGRELHAELAEHRGDLLRIGRRAGLATLRVAARGGGPAGALSARRGGGRRGVERSCVERVGSAQDGRVSVGSGDHGRRGGDLGDLRGGAWSAGNRGVSRISGNAVGGHRRLSEGESGVFGIRGAGDLGGLPASALRPNA